MITPRSESVTFCSVESAPLAASLPIAGRASSTNVKCLADAVGRITITSVSLPMIEEVAAVTPTAALTYSPVVSLPCPSTRSGVAAESLSSLVNVPS